MSRAERARIAFNNKLQLQLTLAAMKRANRQSDRRELIDAYELKAGINVTIFQMPNKKAKHRKQERKRKNAWLIKFGRTAKQIARWKRKNKGKSMTEKKRW